MLSSGFCGKLNESTTIPQPSGKVNWWSKLIVKSDPEGAECPGLVAPRLFESIKKLSLFYTLL